MALSLLLGLQVQVWSGSLGQPRGCRGSLPLSPALSVAVSPDGDRVAVGYRADGIRIYKISSGTKGKRGGVFEPLERALPPLTPLPSILQFCFLSFSRFPGGSVSGSGSGSVCPGLAEP